ncbi:transposase [Catenibacterium sp.]|uniref:transposase n=1 Tax=Catenibacterium sp. TaxID=2049022 RepID=UPI003993C3E1
MVQLLRNDVTYFYDHCTYDTAKKQLEKIIIDFRSSAVAEMSPVANTLTNWKKEIINSFIIVDDKANRKMNTAIVENRNKSIKLSQACLKRLSELGAISQSYPLYIK